MSPSTAGDARVTHIPIVKFKNIRDFAARNAYRKSQLHTDESKLYPGFGSEFATHETVNHRAKEYAPGDMTTNSAEGFFGIFKGAMIGVYQHCGEQNFQRYLNEFAFRYNNRIKLGVNDDVHTLIALRGTAGKRLTYRRVNAA